MERAFKIGCRVIFFDSHRQAHEGIVTNWFHGGSDGQTVAEWLAENTFGRTANNLPCCNIVWVSDDVDRKDSYGRQLERQTSTPYGRSMGSIPFLGMCWCWPDEEEEARALVAKAL